MRTFVISDIHGYNELFKKALKAVRLKKTDRLIILGDLIDRGPDSKGVLDTIILLLEHGFVVECLMGNHERMFLDAELDTNTLNQWLLNGGDKTLFSFLTKSIGKIPQKYIDLIKSFKYYIEDDSFIFVHAALNMTIDQPFTDINTLLWERDTMKLFNHDWMNQRVLIHGHTPKSYPDIINSLKNKGKAICVDNGVYLKNNEFGGLCILELETLTPTFLK